MNGPFDFIAEAAAEIVALPVTVPAKALEKIAEAVDEATR